MKKYWAVLCVGVVLFWIRLMLRVWRLPRVLVALTPGSVTAARNDSVMDDLTYSVDRWLHVVPSKRRGNSFPRSLALYWYACHMGYPVQFHCGVRMGYLHLEDYAWLTWNGEPFHELTGQWETYTLAYSYPPDAASAGAPIESSSFKTRVSSPS